MRTRLGWMAGLFGVLTASSAASALPVIPDAAGFGMDTAAGRGGAVFRVTTLAASGSGSLKECVDASGPRVCIFEVSGVIELTKNLVVKNPFITIAGQTAPSPGILIRGAGLIVQSHDVLVQHLRVRPGDDPDGPAGTNRDALSIANSAEAPYNVIIDHCTFGWSIDEMISTWYEVGDVTFRHVFAAEALDDSIHVDEGTTDGTTDLHGFGPLFGPSNGRIAFYGSLLAHNRGRQPLTFTAELVWVNNVHYDRLQAFSTLGNREGIATKNSFVGNVYIEGPALADWAADSEPITLSNEFTLASKLYVSDNVWSENASPNDQWELVNNDSDQSRAEVEATSPPTWVEGLVAKPTANDEALDWVLAQAGARPLDRDAVELRVLDEVVSGTGTVINCVSDDGSERCEKNGGGWASYAENTISHTLPDDPNGDADDDGYTNLEEWLHDRAADVEGAGGSAGGGTGGSAGASGSGNASGSSGAGGGSSGSAGSGSGGTSGSGTGGAAAESDGDADSGCGCRLPARSSSNAGSLALLLALAGAVARRRRW